eukprot:GSChrysophyteH1.ASY1.ANO1.759.1 assembled CDS
MKNIHSLLQIPTLFRRKLYVVSAHQILETRDFLVDILIPSLKHALHRLDIVLRKFGILLTFQFLFNYLHSLLSLREHLLSESLRVGFKQSVGHELPG